MFAYVCAVCVLCIGEFACAAALSTVRDGAITIAVSVSHERDVLAFDTAGTYRYVVGKWLDRVRSTEEMKRGRANEGNFVRALAALEHVRNVFDIGLAQMKGVSF